uniref:Uncharacterized protein n=1 Tax=Anguilla anguilla TaxID=7936 RepID=A0A0E9QND0_ANGAN
MPHRAVSNCVCLCDSMPILKRDIYFKLSLDFTVPTYTVYIKQMSDLDNQLSNTPISTVDTYYK